MVEEIVLIFCGSYISKTKLFNIIGPHCQHIPKSQKMFLKLSCTLVQALTLREAPSQGEAGSPFRWIRTSRAIEYQDTLNRVWPYFNLKSCKFWSKLLGFFTMVAKLEIHWQTLFGVLLFAAWSAMKSSWNSLSYTSASKTTALLGTIDWWVLP